MKTSEFDFAFPKSLIAFEPLPRGESRMLVVNRAAEESTVTFTRRLADFLSPGDALVLNDTRVLRARLLGRSPAGAKVEALLLSPRPPAASQTSTPGVFWEAMVKPAKRFKVGDQAEFPPNLSAIVTETLPDGTRILKFDLTPEEFHRELERSGHVPLPPYIRRPDVADDVEAYQSVFAEKPGSVAAPTASLHLSREMLEEIADKGVGIHKVTLHVGAGTFKPVQSEDIEAHAMHAEAFDVSADTAEALNAVRRGGGRIWAVGTTVARVLESQAVGDAENLFRSGFGKTSIFIYPGYAWKAVDGLLTNFHWPKSTLFMLVCSLLGTDRARRVYEEAFSKGFRLFSYGDAMLIR